MSDVGGQPPSEGWYAIAGNPQDLAYFDGRSWTWRRWRDPSGEWRQEPLVPPSATVPQPLAGHGAGPPGGPPPGAAGTASGGYPGLPPYPGGAPYGPPGQQIAGPRTSPAASSGGPGVLDLHLDEPERQARWKTLLRAVLVIPNLIVLAILEIAVFFVAILMWFAALFTARVPESLWRFTSDVLKWQARTYAYAYFLTDRYPPFTLGDAPYPVSMSLVGPPDRFNRASVFFRGILLVPAFFVNSIFTYGLGIFAIAAWLLTLVAGRCPRALHLALAAGLRYSLRVSAFELLLTTHYPSRPLGDPLPPAGAASLPAGEIVLTGGAKTVAVVAMVVGVMALVLTFVGDAAVFSTALKKQHAITEFNAMQSRTFAAATSFRSAAAACAPGTWQCVRSATPILARSLATQISTLRSVAFPTSATRRDADALIAELRRDRAAVGQMEHAATSQDLQTAALRLEAITRQVEPLARKLVRDLNTAP